MSEHRPRHVAAALAVSLLLAACSGDDDDDDSAATDPSAPATTEGAAPSGTDAGPATTAQAVTGEPELTFGFIHPGVGLLNDLAIGQERALTLAVEDINAAGGVLDAPVAFIRADEAAPEPIDSVVDALVGDGADVLVGPVGSSSTASLLPVLAERSLLACSASATATTLTDGNPPGTFVRTALRDDYFAGIVADQLMFPPDDSDPPATVMIVGRDDLYGNELTGALSAELTARGATVDTITYPPRRVTFAEEAAAVAAAVPDVVLLPAYTEAPNLVAQLVTDGVAVDRIVGLDGLLVPRIAEQTFPDDPTRADGLRVIGTTGDRALMARLGEVPAPQDQVAYGAQMYDCAISLALAAIAAESTDPETIGLQLRAVTADGRTCSTFAHCVELLAAGEDIDYDGATGRIDFDAAGDISSARITTAMVIDGQLQPTASEDLDLVLLRQQDIFASSVFVTQLQQALKVLGFFEGDITGVYDEATTAAVAALQASLGLPETGEYDEATDAALRERLGATSDTFSAAVAQLQQALADRGLYTGPIDGRYTAATADAVRAFQRQLGVPETGVLDVATLQAIYASGITTGVASVPTTTLPSATTAPPTTAPPTTAPPPTAPPTAAPTTAAPPPTAAPTTAPPTPTTQPEEPEPELDDLYTVLSDDGRFVKFLQLLDTAGFGADFTAPVPVTVFAPIDDAFGDVDLADLTSEEAAEIVRDLAVDELLTADDLGNLEGAELRTIGGTEVPVDATSFGGAPIVPPELTASNGIVHPLETVPG